MPYAERTARCPRGGCRRTATVSGDGRYGADDNDDKDHDDGEQDEADVDNDDIDNDDVDADDSGPTSTATTKITTRTYQSDDIHFGAAIFPAL